MAQKKRQGQQQEHTRSMQSQNPNRDPVEGPPASDSPGRDQVGGQWVQSEGSQRTGQERLHDRDEMSEGEDRGQHGGGITNRTLEEEQREQDELPDRGTSRSEG